MSALIRSAGEADLAGILAIYNDAVVNTTAIWNEVLVDIANRRAWLELRRAQGYPVLVAERGGGVVGYASFGDFRPFDGYRLTVEHSVYVAADARGQGIGSALLQALFPLARGLGKQVMVGGIDATNTPSLRLHEKLGFRETGRMPGVGTKFGKRLDLVLMQKELGAE
jgi:L-amino acid N-acyltransferase